MIQSVAVFLLLLSVTYTLDCHGPADIVVAVPASEIVPDSEFEYFESFLVNLTRYYDLPQTQIGLVVYGNDTKVIADLKSNLNAFETNTRITILSQRRVYDDVISGDLDLAAAIETVHEMLMLEGREVATKIGVILTYGGLAHVASENETDDRTMDEILSAADKALDDGVKLYAVASNGSIPYFKNITRDTCRLFSLDSNVDLKSMVPYIASSMCYLINGSVTQQPDSCFPELKQPPQLEEFTSCPSRGVTFLPDPSNCAYWYYCFGGNAIRQPCPDGTLFDSSINRCNGKDEVSCFSRISCPEPLGMFKHPSDCSKFLNCFQNVPRVMTCPEGTLFNAEMGYCDYENNVQCLV